MQGVSYEYKSMAKQDQAAQYLRWRCCLVQRLFGAQPPTRSIAIPSSDQNQRDQNLDQYPNYGGSAELRETALNAGYNQGSRQASYDRQNGGQPNYRNSDVYRRATQDYNSRLGDRELYRRYFREAFEKGTTLTLIIKAMPGATIAINTRTVITTAIERGAGATGMATVTLAALLNFVKPL